MDSDGMSPKMEDCDCNAHMMSDSNLLYRSTGDCKRSKKTFSRALELERLLEETEAETVILKSRADLATQEARESRLQLEQLQQHQFREQEEKLVVETNLRESISKLEETLHDKQAEIEAAMEMARKFKDEAESSTALSLQLDRAFANISELQKKLEDMEIEKNGLQHEKDKAEKHIRVLDEQQKNDTHNAIKQYEHVELLQEYHVQNEEQIRKLRSQIEKDKLDYNYEREQSKHLKNELEICASELQVMHAAQEALSKHCHDIVTSASQAIETAQQDASDKIATFVEQELELNGQISEVRGRLREQTQELEEERTRIHMCRDSTEKKLYEEIEVLKEQSTNFRNTQAAETAAKEAAETHARELTEETEKLRTSISRREHQLEEMKQENITLRESAKEHERKISELTVKLNESDCLLDQVVRNGEEMSHATKKAVEIAEENRARAEKQAEKSSFLTKKASAVMSSLFKRLVEVQKIKLPQEANTCDMISFMSESGNSEDMQSFDDFESKAEAVVADIEIMILDQTNGLENDKMRQDVVRLESEISSFKKEIIVLQKNIENLENSLSGKSRDLDIASAEVDKLQSIIYDLEQKESELSHMLDQHDRDAENKLRSLECEHLLLEQNMRQGMKEIAELRGKLEESSSQLVQAEEERDNLTEKLEEFECRAKQIQEQFDERIQGSAEGVKMLQSQLETMASLRSAESEASSQLLEESMVAAEDLRKQNNDLLAEISLRQSDVTKVTQEKSNLASELRKVKDEVSKAYGKAEAFQEQLRLSSINMQCVSEERDSLREATRELSDQASILQGEIDQVRLELREQEMKHFDELKERLESKDAEHEKEMGAARSEHSLKFERATVEHEALLSNLRTENEKTKDEFEEMHEKYSVLISGMATEKNRLEDDLKTISFQLEAATEAVERQTMQRDKLQQDVLDSKAFLEEVQSKLQDALSELELSSSSCRKLQEGNELAKNAIMKLESNLELTRKEASEAVKERDETVERLLKELETAQKKAEDAAQDIARIRGDSLVLESKLDHIQSKVMSGMEREKEEARRECRNLEGVLGVKDLELAELKEKIQTMEDSNTRLLHAEHKLKKAEDDISARDASLSKLAAKLETCAKARDDAESALSERDNSAANIRARLMTLEAELESVEELSRENASKAERKAKELAQARHTISKLQEQVAMFDLEQSTSSEKPGDVDLVAEAQREMIDALEKYDAVLEKNNRLRKRAKRLEVLLEIERKKNVSASVSAPDTSISSKREFSPNAKGLSPSIKRAREALQRTPLSPLATNTRPPLAPRPNRA